jgi:hypothetical protein
VFGFKRVSSSRKPVDDDNESLTREPRGFKYFWRLKNGFLIPPAYCIIQEIYYTLQKIGILRPASCIAPMQFMSCTEPPILGNIHVIYYSENITRAMPRVKRSYPVNFCLSLLTPSINSELLFINGTRAPQMLPLRLNLQHMTFNFITHEKFVRWRTKVGFRNSVR